MKSALLLSTFLFIFQFGMTQQDPSIDWQFSRLGDNLGLGGILVYDFDEDGVNEIFSTGAYYPNVNYPADYFTVIAYDEGQDDFVTEWVSPVLYAQILSSGLYDLNEDGKMEVFLGLSNNTIAVYETGNWQQTRSVSVFGINYRDIEDMVFADVDNDSETDLIATNGYDSTFVLNRNLEVIHRIPHAAEHIRAGNIDADAAIEIIFSDGVIMQWEGGSFVEEYTFPTYNSEIQVGLSKINDDEAADLIYTVRDTIFAYDFKAGQLIWSTHAPIKYNGGNFSAGIWLYDYDQDQTADVFVSSQSEDRIYCYNGATGAEAFVIGEDGIADSDAVVSLVVSDLDNDDELELIWSSGAYSSFADQYCVYELFPPEKKWLSRYYIRDLKAFDVGDVDNDEALEIVIANYGSFLDYRDHGFINIFNAMDKTLEWTGGDHTTLGLRINDLTAVKIADIDNDEQNELLFGLHYRYNRTYVQVYDSTYTFQRSFQIDLMDIILGIEVSDVDADQQNELIITAGTNVSAGKQEDYKNHIFIFDGATGELEWQSEQLGGVYSKIGSLQIGNIDTDEALEIVAVRYGSYKEDPALIVIDGITHETIVEETRDYSAVELVDLNGDGTMDILAASGEGQLLAMDGTSLEIIETVTLPLAMINAIKAYDMNGDGQQELVLADQFSLALYDPALGALRWQSKPLNNAVGAFNSMKVVNLDEDEKIEVLINANHAIYSFEIDFDALPILTDVSNGETPNTTRLYPNPVKDQLYLEVTTKRQGKVQVNLLNLNGQLVKAVPYGKLPAGEHRLDLKVSELSAGSYYCLILGDGQLLSSHKLVKVD